MTIKLIPTIHTFLSSYDKEGYRGYKVAGAREVRRYNERQQRKEMNKMTTKETRIGFLAEFLIKENESRNF